MRNLICHAEKLPEIETIKSGHVHTPGQDLDGNFAGPTDKGTRDSTKACGDKQRELWPERKFNATGLDRIGGRSHALPWLVVFQLPGLLLHLHIDFWRVCTVWSTPA